MPEHYGAKGLIFFQGLWSHYGPVSTAHIVVQRVGGEARGNILIVVLGS